MLIDAGKRTESILLAQIDNSVLPIQVLFTLELQSGDQPLDIVNLVSKFGDFKLSNFTQRNSLQRPKIQG